MSDRAEQVLDYHRGTKHRFDRFAPGPGRLNWETQPDPFRRYHGAPLIELEQVEPGRALSVEEVNTAPFDMSSVSQLFYDSLALSVWKRAGDVTWALRVNPSSGNLHPTEGYLICGPVPRLTKAPLVGHYAPREHALEVRCEFPLETWDSLSAGLPPGTILIALTSIHWREAWKYGERSFRYCQLDVGHAIGALSVAAAGLGWSASLLDDLGSEELGLLVGISDSQGAEPEHPDCLLAIHPGGSGLEKHGLASSALAGFSGFAWRGRPNRQSPRRREWPAVDGVASATEKPPTTGVYGVEGASVPERHTPPAPLFPRRVIRQRRSAAAMDGRAGIDRDIFFRILSGTLATVGQAPLGSLPWSPRVHLMLFVHRVRDLAPGLYMLVRQPGERTALRAAMKADFAWQKPLSCPAGLDLYLLVEGDVRALSRRLSCQQAIASDGCFSLGMVARFEEPILSYGPWFYRRLFWECGLIGQVLYLEAEAAGVRGTGIGCFFDDPVHSLFGLTSPSAYQSLYHFTVGHPVEDTRLETLPAYPPH